MKPWKKYLSYLWPLREERGHSPLQGYLEVRWEAGRKVLNGRLANYSYGALQRVFRQALVGDQWKPQGQSPVLILGLGGGCVAQLLREEFGFTGRIVGVESDAEVLRLSRKHFASVFTGLEVVQEDALSWIQDQREAYQLIIVDLFEDNRPVMGSLDANFLRALRGLLLPQGTLYHNLMLPRQQWPAAEEEYRKVFSKVVLKPVMGLNLVIRAQR